MSGFDILTVSQLNFYLKSIIEGDNNLRSIFLRGEISNFKSHFSSGHLYFSLKDEKAVVKCVMFAGRVGNIKFSPKDGMKVLLRGRVSVYEVSGQYQVYVEDMQPEGIGELHFAFEQLKEKLLGEGLFDVSNKKKLKKFPKNVGVITSRSGAVLHDIKNVVSRRYPLCNIILKPVSVQGSDAAPQIINAIRLFNQQSAADVLIIGRGGGSIEDLWAFNDERLARAVFESDIPVISAVGHETDFTICDFVADLRAPTPSAAAELAVPDAAELRNYIDDLFAYARSSVESSISSCTSRLSELNLQLKSFSPESRVKTFSLNLEALRSRLVLSTTSSVEKKNSQFSELTSKLEALSPLSILNRGYSIVYKNESVVKKIDDVASGDIISVRLSDGVAQCEVKNSNKFNQ